MIAIVDYGAGNVESVRHALERIGADSILTHDKDSILAADGVILPGVGAFGEAMRQIKARGLTDTLRRVRQQNKPFLGICIGEQLMFETSEESPGAAGLCFMEGSVQRIAQHVPGCKVPHMGWNQLEHMRHDPLFQGLGERPWFYFVHSFYVQANNKDTVLAQVEYAGNQMDVAVRDNMLWAVQFHPEKSGEAGRRLLKNFVDIVKGGAR